jgi:hypothetical protein
MSIAAALVHAAAAAAAAAACTFCKQSAACGPGRMGCWHRASWVLPLMLFLPLVLQGFGAG